MEKSKDFCFECDDEVEYEVREINKRVRVKDVFLDLKIYEAHCKKCGARMIVNEVERKNDKIIYDAYKAKLGLMTGKELVELRQKYGLSAVAFAKILGLGEKNVTRYETGTVQSESIDGYLKMARNEEEFWKRYKEKRDELEPKERVEADAKLEAYGSTYSTVYVPFCASPLISISSLRRKEQVISEKNSLNDLVKVPLA